MARISKKQLLAQRAKIEKELNKLGIDLSDSIKTDAENDWATNVTTALRAKFDAYDEMSKLFNDDAENAATKIILKDANNYIVSTDSHMGAEFWYRFCDWCKKWVASIEFYCKDAKAEEALELCLMYAIGFNRAGIVNLALDPKTGARKPSQDSPFKNQPQAGGTPKGGSNPNEEATASSPKPEENEEGTPKGGSLNENDPNAIFNKDLGMKDQWVAVNIVEHNKETGIAKGSIMYNWIDFATRSTTIENLNNPTEGMKINVEGDLIDLVDGKNGSIIIWNIEGIPDYVYLIPFIMKEIYFERQREKNMAFLGIMPAIKSPNSQHAQKIAAILTDVNSYELWTQGDPQDIQDETNQYSSFLEDIKWYVPPAEAVNFMAVMDDNLRALKESFHTRFGWPIAANGGQQVLAANANMELADIEYKSLAKYRRVARFFDALTEMGLKIEFPDFEHKENIAQNDNATKEGFISHDQENGYEKGGEE